MRTTINITFDVTPSELDLLKAGKCDSPHPQRMKLMLLSQARANVRRQHDMVLQVATKVAHEHMAQPAKTKQIEKLLLAKEKRRQRDQRRLDKLAKPKPITMEEAQRKSRAAVLHRLRTHEGISDYDGHVPEWLAHNEKLKG